MGAQVSGDISVVMPTYNGARFVEEALQSVFAQTSPPGEIIVVDDCSKDDTMAVVERLARHAPVELRTITLPSNSGGPARPINVGIEAARCDYIAVLDQDDAYVPDILGRAVATLRSAPKCSVAFYWVGDLNRPESGARQSEGLRAGLCGSGAERDGFLEIPGPMLLGRLISEGMFAGGYPGFVFRRKSWQAMRGVDESLRIASDMQAMGWLLQQGNGALIPSIGYLRRVHGANTTNNRTRMCYEISVVVAELLRTAECLKRQPAVVEQGKAMVRGSAYMLRQAQRYGEAAELYRILAKLGESTGVTASALTKVHVHRIMSKIFRWLPEYSEFTRPRGAGLGEIDTTRPAKR